MAPTWRRYPPSAAAAAAVAGSSTTPPTGNGLRDWKTPGSGTLMSVELPRSREALERARRMLDDLARHSANTIAFRDRIPYVLDLLAGVTRTISRESSGHRTQAFADWWSTADRSSQQAMEEMRHAELKGLESRTAASINVEINVRAADHPDRNLNDGDTLTTIDWLFKGGTFDDKPVLPTLHDYLRQVGNLVDEAERKLSP